MNFGGIFDYDEKAHRLIVVNAEFENPDIWNDPERAQELGREKKCLEAVVTELDDIRASLKDSRELFELASLENEEELFLAVETDAEAIGARIEELEFRRMFSNPADP